jgi:hypothetical protein
MALLYGRAGGLTAENGGFRPGQMAGVVEDEHDAAALADAAKKRGTAEFLKKTPEGIKAALAPGGAAMECPSPLNALKDTHDQSCCHCARSDGYQRLMTGSPAARRRWRRTRRPSS